LVFSVFFLALLLRFFFKYFTDFSIFFKSF